MKPFTNLLVSILSLFRSCNFTSSNSPNWLISNYNMTPLAFVDYFGNCCELTSVDFGSFTGFSFLKKFTNAKKNLHVIINGQLCF